MIGVAKIGLGEYPQGALSEILAKTTYEISKGLCQPLKKIARMSIVEGIVITIFTFGIHITTADTPTTTSADTTGRHATG